MLLGRAWVPTDPSHSIPHLPSSIPRLGLIQPWGFLWAFPLRFPPLLGMRKHQCNDLPGLGPPPQPELRSSVNGAGGHVIAVPSGPMLDPPAGTSCLRCLPASLVKPDPPEDLRVSPIPGETKKLLLEWSPPGSWPFPEYFPLKYRIRYARGESSVTKTVLPIPPLHPPPSHRG